MSKRGGKWKRKQNRVDYDVDTVALGTEVTGLIPAGLNGEAQAESYAQLHPIHRQKT